MAVDRLLLIFIILSIIPRPALAVDNMFCDKELSFGTFGIADNDGVYRIILDADNSVTYDTAMVDGPVPPQRMECSLENLTPDTTLDITIADTTLSVDGLGGDPKFTISNYTHNGPVTDSAGDAILYIGAELSTSGSGQHYPTGHYAGTFDLTIVF